MSGVSLVGRGKGQEQVPSYKHGEAGHAEQRGADVAEASLTCSVGDVSGLLADVN